MVSKGVHSTRESPYLSATAGEQVERKQSVWSRTNLALGPDTANSTSSPLPLSHHSRPRKPLTMADQPPAEPTATFLFSKKSRSRPSALRKRPLSPDPSTVSEPSTSEVIIVPRKQALNHLIQGTSNAKRRRADADALALVSSDEEESSFKVQHSAKTVRPRRRSSSPPAEMSAESIQAALRPKGEVDEVKDDGMYHGSKGAAHKLPKAFGPVKGGPGNVRTITLVDYQPDVCKDYKGAFFPSCSRRGLS